MANITAEHIRAEVKKLIAEVTEREPEEITDTALFAEELGVDSLMAMEVMVAVDKKYKINIPEDEFAKIKNVNDTVAVVQRHMGPEAVNAAAVRRKAHKFVRRVVITGVGLVTPIGAGRETFWRNLTAGVNGIGPVESFDTSAFPVHIGAEVKDFHPQGTAKRTWVAARGRGGAHGARGFRDRRRRAGPLAHRGLDGDHFGRAAYIERYNDIRKARGWSRFRRISSQVPLQRGSQQYRHRIRSARAVPHDSDGLRGGQLRHRLRLRHDPVGTHRSDARRRGADPFSRITYMGFARLGAIAPERCQPFDKNRQGMVPGEGSAILVLEPLDAALARGATIYAEVLGYGLSCDAHHMTAAHPQGDGAVRAMAMAVKESGVSLEDIDYISAHGTGTPTNDRAESIAMKALFGERAPKVPMSSIKSMLGHTMGAASAIEAVACSLAIQTGVIPPTINYEEPDPGMRSRLRAQPGARRPIRSF